MNIRSLAGSGVASTGLTKESLSVPVVLEEGDQVGEYLDVVLPTVLSEGK